MDQLQYDATQSYSLAQRLSKRRDSMSPEEPKPEINKKPTAEIDTGTSEVDAEMSEVSEARWKSTKVVLESAGRWVQDRGRKVYHQEQARRGAARASSSQRHRAEEDLEMQNAPGRIEYLMLGLKARGGTSKNRLIQVPLRNPPGSDAEFFKLLERQYSEHCIRYWGIPNFFKKIRGIYFVEFRTYHPDQSQHCIRIVGIHSLPPERTAGWIRKMSPYHPPKPDTMKYHLENRTVGQSRALDVFPEVPRKLDTEIPQQGGITGWGLYYREGTRWTWIYLIIGIVFIINAPITMSAIIAQ